MKFKHFFLQFLIFGCTVFSVAANVPDSLHRHLALQTGKDVLVFANKMASEDLEVAKFAFDLALGKALFDRDQPLLFSVLRDKGIFFEDQNQLDSAEFFYKKALVLAEKETFAEPTRTALNDLAIISRKLTKFQDAENYHRSALQKAAEAHDVELEEFSLHGLGFLYENVGDYDAAAHYYLESYEIAKKRESPEGRIVTLTNLAGMRMAANRRDSAFLHVREALNLAFSAHDTAQIAHVYHVLAAVFEHFSQSDSAQVFYQISANLAAQSHNWSLRAASFLDLGLIAEKSGDWKSAEKFYQNIHVAHFSSLPPEQKVEVFFRLGKILMAQNQPELGLNFLSKAYFLADEFSLAESQIEVGRELFSFFQKKNDTQKALFYLAISDKLSDSLSVVSRETGTAALDFRYNLVKKDRELQEMDIRQSRVRIGFVILMGLLLVGGLFFLVKIQRKSNADLRQKNEAIRDQNLRLEESNKFLHQFTYAVAHDLKEPLRSISGFLGLLERRHPEKFAGEGQEYLQFVRQGVARMTDLIADLLAFSNISSQRPGQEKIDSRLVLGQTISKLDSEIRLKNGSVELPEAMPEVVMKSEHLGQLFQNLIHNALKFNHNEHPTVKVGAVRLNGHVIFSVEDNGIGIDADHAKKIYELFHQLNKNQPYGGTGVGLTVCKNIVDKYKGAIWFEAAAAEHGTRFLVKLPA